MLVWWTTLSLSGEGYDYKVIAEFERPGSQPLGALIPHSNGDIYGTTVAGGAHGRGTVFRLAPDGYRETLYSFGLDDGSAPISGLVEAPGGDLWGTTSEGGALGYGTVYRLTLSGLHTRMVDFTGANGTARGSVPGQLILHPAGLCYGTTAAGGEGGWGTVFQLSPTGELTTLISFTGDSGARPGTEPQGQLAVLGDRLFGVTRAGGAGGYGTVFSVSRGGVFESVIEFLGVDGSGPSGGLSLHPDGRFYGVTELGGQNGVGVVFRFDPLNPGPVEVIHHFSDASGSQPAGVLALDPAGDFYGMASVGGKEGWGGLFRLGVDGAYQLLVSLSGTEGFSPGASPRSGLVEDGEAGFIGATSAGGVGQRGVVFRLALNGDYLPLADFSSDPGWAPSGAPVSDGLNRSLFSMAQGGTGGLGAIMAVGVDGSLSRLQDYTPAIGGRPAGSLTPTSGGWLSVTGEGGSFDRGSIVLMNPPAEPVVRFHITSLAGEGVRGPLIEVEGVGVVGVSERVGLGGHGSIFKVTPNGGFERLLTFTGTSGTRPGSGPQAPLALGLDGNLYGVTDAGGTSDQGVIFRIDTAGNFSLLSEFGETGPRRPRGGLVRGVDGRLFGTTSLGGEADAGTVFELIPTDGSWVVKAEFTGSGGPIPGGGPIGPLTAGPSGHFFGMTQGGPSASGTAFSFSPSSGIRSLVVFTGTGGTSPGDVIADPEAQVEWIGGLNEGPDGFLYGVTPAGGSGGGGVVFRLRPSADYQGWKEQELGDAAASDLADPDRDGLSNLLEYALQRSPKVPDGAVFSPRSIVVNGESRLELVVDRDSSRSDITLVVEAAPSPYGPWTSVATSADGGPFSGEGAVEEVSLGSGVWRVFILDTRAQTPELPRFMRLRVVY